MNSGRWQKLKEIFNEALEREQDERKAYISKACGDDQKLKKEILSLLKAYHKPGILDNSPGQLISSAFFQHEPVNKKGEKIGSYKILERIGQGGMGCVYIAERSDGQFEQKVALKLLRTGFTSANQRQRFLAERQILASLNHKNIARLYDGGVTRESQPWFAMEYVEGQPIDKYCTANNLSLNERLKLFRKVCEAVQYAHRKLVIHRDLKPSNILVTQNDTVKLLDFGIAKVINQKEEIAEKDTLTQTGFLPLTPAYASPEQIQNNAVTTASDIYQLGIILYELLCGCQPYDVSGKTPSEIERIICEELPKRPSTAIKSLTDSQENLHNFATNRPAEPDQLQKQLRGDLDTIIMKSLRKESIRRYDSAEQLATDIQNYLAGRPVTAHPDSLTYRTTKFIRRHTLGVAASAAIILLLLGYAATITWHSQRTRAALEQSQRETEKAEQVTNFLISLFEQANPYRKNEFTAALNDTLTTTELLSQGATRVRQELSDQSLVQAKVMYKLGRIYRMLGHFDKAEPLLEDALSTQRNHSSVNPANLANNLHELARLLRNKGEIERPKKLYEEAIEIQHRHLGDKHADIANNLHELGIIAAREGKFNLADSLFNEGLAMQKSVLGQDHPDVATGLHLLGLLHVLKDDLSDAERLLRQSLDIRRNYADSDHPQIAETMDRLGQVLIKQGNIVDAEPLLRKAWDIRKKHFRKKHPTRAVSLNNMGRLLLEKNNYEEADRMFKEAQNIYTDLYGPKNMDVASTLMERARVYKSKGDLYTSEKFYQKAISIQRLLHGRDNPYTQRFLRELSDLYSTWGKNHKKDSLQSEIMTELK